MAAATADVKDLTRGMAVVLPVLRSWVRDRDGDSVDATSGSLEDDDEAWIRRADALPAVELPCRRDAAEGAAGEAGALRDFGESNDSMGRTSFRTGLTSADAVTSRCESPVFIPPRMVRACAAGALEAALPVITSAMVESSSSSQVLPWVVSPVPTLDARVRG